MASWKGSQALADGLRPGFSDRGLLNSTPNPVVTPMAGFEPVCRPHPPGGHTPNSCHLQVGADGFSTNVSGRLDATQGPAQLPQS